MKEAFAISMFSSHVSDHIKISNNLIPGYESLLDIKLSFFFEKTETVT